MRGSWLGLVIVGCGGPVAMTSASSGTETTVVASGGTPSVPTGTGGASYPGEGDLDLPSEETTVPGPGCDGSEPCPLDVLFVVDNTGSMAEEQAALAAGVPQLVAGLRGLRDTSGEPLALDVHVMVTTTDMGHPGCAVEGHEPAAGAPIASACSERLARFDGLDGVTHAQAVCLDACPEGQAAVPADPFVHFVGDVHNVVDEDGEGDAVVDALACLLPQGIDGCRFASPLEAMLQALDPNKPWNVGAAPFLRREAALAIVVVTGASDCSLKNPDYFDPGRKDDPDYNQYWEDVPGIPGVKQEPTPAVCWNAGMACGEPGMDGVYAACEAVDRGVLQPVSRYHNYIREVLGKGLGKSVVMLAITGVPPVTAHSMYPPFEPTAGGVEALTVHDWRAVDVLPGDPQGAAEKQYELGIGPGCSVAGIGQGLPPGRLQAVCEGLNVADDPETDADETRVRCCIESVCDGGYAGAAVCLVGLLTPRASQF